MSLLDKLGAIPGAKATLSMREHIELKVPMEYRNEVIDAVYRDGWRVQTSGPARISETRVDLDFYSVAAWRLVKA